MHEISRRDFMARTLLASALLPALVVTGKDGQAAELTPLDASDPTAKALGFTTDASHVDVSAAPTFKAGQHCAVCAQYQGKATDASGGCVIFAGHSVPAGGWCQAWTKRSA